MRFAAVLCAGLALAACSRDNSEFGLPTGVVERGLPNAGAGQYSALAVDALGHLHVAYFHADLNALRYAEFIDGAWSPQTVDEPDAVSATGRHASMRAKGETVGIAYQKTIYRDESREAAEQEELWFAEGDLNGFKTEKVDPSSFRVGDFIAFDYLTGTPAVAYYDATNDDLMLAMKSGGAWTVEALDKLGSVGSYVSMQAGAEGNLHLAYYDGSNGALKYGVWDEGEYEPEHVHGFAGPDSDAVNVGTWTAIRTQPAGSIDPQAVSPKILYYDESRRVLRLAERDGKAWKFSVVDTQNFTGTDAAFVWLPEGDLVVAYFDGYNLDLKLARRSAGGWSYETRLSQGAVGMFNAMERLPSGKLALTTYNLSRGELDFLLLPVRP